MQDYNGEIPEKDSSNHMEAQLGFLQSQCEEYDNMIIKIRERMSSLLRLPVIMGTVVTTSTIILSEGKVIPDWVPIGAVMYESIWLARELVELIF